MHCAFKITAVITVLALNSQKAFYRIQLVDREANTNYNLLLPSLKMRIDSLVRRNVCLST